MRLPRALSPRGLLPSVFAVSPTPPLLPLTGAQSAASALPPAGLAAGGSRLPAPGSRFSGVQLQLLWVFAESQHELLFVVEALCIVYLLGQLDGEDLRFHVDHRLLVGRAGDGHATT